MCTEVHSYVMLFSYWPCRKFEMASAQRFCTLVCAVIFNVFVFVLCLSIIVRFIPRFYHECC